MRRWILNYELAGPRLKECPTCCGIGSWLIARATRWDPEEWGWCETCEGTGSIPRKVNVYRKRWILKSAA